MQKYDKPYISYEFVKSYYLNRRVIVECYY